MVLDAVPECPGAYFLFDLLGRPLYVGKAKCLRDTVRRHFLPSEANPLLRDQIGAVRLYPTGTRRAAEDQEGRLFDRYLRATGRYPPGNRHRPPGAMITDSEIIHVSAFSAFATAPAPGGHRPASPDGPRPPPRRPIPRPTTLCRGCEPSVC
ncbi:MAG: hypothetical protein JWO38_5018 [Gemmataceae bacterium]|nr:hypothetical protein [Gemmataceae bacterium]